MGDSAGPAAVVDGGRAPAATAVSDSRPAAPRAGPPMVHRSLQPAPAASRAVLHATYRKAGDCNAAGIRWRSHCAPGLSRRCRSRVRPRGVNQDFRTLQDVFVETAELAFTCGPASSSARCWTV